MKKRILTMLLALVMVLSLSTVAFADDGINTADELKTAIASGGEIVVTGDITLTEAITISNTVTIKANTAVTITANDATDVFTANAGGNLTLGENIKVVSNTSVLYANGGTINIDGAEISVAGSNYCAAFAENNGTINVKAGSISQSDAKVTIDTTNATVNVSGGTVHSENDSAIAARAGATVNITGGTVSTNATAMKAAAYALNGGKVVVNGGSVKSLNENATSYALVAGTGGAVDVQSGTVSGTKGAALAHEGATASATISGGTIEGQVSAANNATLTISGGTFNTDVSDYLANGFEMNANGDGTYGVQEKTDEPEQIKVHSASVDMGNTLDMFFYIKKSAVVGENYTAKITINDETDEVAFANWGTDETGYYYFVVCDGILAKQMTDEVTVEIYSGETKVSETWTDSIQAYVGRLLQKDGVSEDAKNAAKAMLRYGSAAQVYKNYKKENLADSILNATN